MPENKYVALRPPTVPSRCVSSAALVPVCIASIRRRKKKLFAMATPTSTTAAIPSCTSAIPDHYGYVPPDACNANYGFYPSWEWNLVFAVVFGLTTLGHTVQMFVYQKVIDVP